MPRRALIVVIALFLSLVAGRAEALSVRDVIELSKAGLSDSVLLALIDVDRSMFSIDPATLKQLKTAGVSDAVIVAMIRSGREPQPVEATRPIPQQPAPLPEPSQTAEPVPMPQPAPYPVTYPVAVPVPVFVTVPMASADRRHVKSVLIAPQAVPPNCVTAGVPNWGFGGKNTLPQNLCR